ncbi:MAG: hypothetical protein ACKOFG_01755, partial [Limnohabitans sp.]
MEADRMIGLLLKLKKDHAMMLVEHDMDAVFALADHLTVMVNGQVIASGTPAQVRADPQVQAAYLGDTPEAPSAPPPQGGDPVARPSRATGSLAKTPEIKHE